MVLRPICEPVELPLGTSVIAETVAVAAEAPAIGRFMHFHDVAELVLFRKVRGEFIADGRRHRLEDGAVVFVPSMRRHDFSLEQGAMEWVLVQFDPYLVQSLAFPKAAARLARPFCAWPDARTRERIDVLAGWLTEAGLPNPAAERVVELLLLAAAEAPERDSPPDGGDSVRFERLLPVLEHMRASPAQPVTLEQAAAMCSLSPAYFSRRFRQVLGLNFSDYVRVYRLHLAARRIATTDAAISAIAYSVGFASPAHFSARFRERFGMTPREYRNGARARAAV
jgi:AraC-like DNA-binding protein